jgi:DNA polymerase
MKISLNQKLINLIEFYNLINANFLLSNAPLKRTNELKTYTFSGTKLEKLKKLKEKISLIKNCECKKHANNMVFGDGNASSKIMIIGEAPGASEDKEGKPFVGRAGKLLDKMLNAIELNRSKVYISNVLNYRPPENRKPTDEEVEKYLPYLISHIEIINPKILFLLGSTALNTLVGNEVVISKARGKWIEKEIGSVKPWVLPSFHPAFLMRQPEQKKLAWIDLKMIKEKSKNLKI